MASEAQKRASARYDAGNTTSVRLKLNINTDTDIIEQLERVGNKNGYIKELIRKDIEQHKAPTIEKSKQLGTWEPYEEKNAFKCSKCGAPTYDNTREICALCGDRKKI